MSTLTKQEFLEFLKKGEALCPVFCLPNDILAGVGDTNDLVPLDVINEAEEEGVIRVRIEQVPHAPMGPRTPPIRICSLTVLGLLETFKNPQEWDSKRAMRAFFAELDAYSGDKKDVAHWLTENPLEGAPAACVYWGLHWSEGWEVLTTLVEDVPESVGSTFIREVYGGYIPMDAQNWRIRHP